MKVGIIGAGFARAAYLPALAHVPGAEVVAIASGRLESARSAALGGALGFTTIWSAFLICGNHFAYWYCHEGMQNTHYQMTLWGIATMIFLSVG